MGAERTHPTGPATVRSMARPARDQPLRAAPRFTPVGSPPRMWDDPVDGIEGDATGSGLPDTHPAAAPRPRTPRSRWRSLLVGVGVGLAVLVAAAGLAFSVVAIPLFFVASTEPGSGAHRDVVRTGLFFVALPFGAVTGLVAGLAVGIWYGRGGRLPDPRR